MKPPTHPLPRTRTARRLEQTARPLKEEIRILRSVIRRVMALADEERTLDEMLRVLDSLSSASTRLAKLLKAEREFAGEAEDLGEVLNQALGEVIETLKRDG